MEKQASFLAWILLIATVLCSCSEKQNVLTPQETTWLNGQEMTHLNDSLIGKANGRVALQIHNGGGIKVQWKNLTIKQL